MLQRTVSPTVQETVMNVKQHSDTIYEVTEQLPKLGQVEFLVDTDIGTCSCLYRCCLPASGCSD